MAEYIRHSALGAVAVSPEQIRQIEMVHTIRSRRASGQSDTAIRAFLSQPGPLSDLHPCSGPSHQNLCSRAEIDFAMQSATGVIAAQDAAQAAAIKKAQAAKKGNGGNLFSTRNLILAGGAVAVLLLLTRKRK